MVGPTDSMLSNYCKSSCSSILNENLCFISESFPDIISNCSLCNINQCVVLVFHTSHDDLPLETNLIFHSRIISKCINYYSQSKLVLECLECLSELVWAPGHEGILGNERADELVKKGADTPFTEPEPLLGLPYSVVKRAIWDWMERKHRVLEVWQRLQALLRASTR